jgi:beta-phosphoglucomutase
MILWSCQIQDLCKVGFSNEHFSLWISTMTIQAILWDLDGVLVDTGEQHFQAWSRTLQHYHIPFSRQLFNETFGMNNWGILTLLLGHPPEPDLYARISAEKEASFRQGMHGQVAPLPGVPETLLLLENKGLRQAIASSAPPENIAALVDELGLREHFQAILSGNNLNGKPAPDIFLAAAAAIDTPPQHCLVIEDAVTGVEAARGAGMLCLAVTNTRPASALRQADYVVDSLLELDDAFWDKLLL